MQSQHRAWLEIDLEALRHNFRELVRRAGSTRLMPVLKADAYGLGARTVARELAAAGAAAFGVATLSEAMELREFGLPVQILGDLFDFEVAPAVAAGLDCPLTSLEAARRISAEAVRQGVRVRGQLTVDSGMGRIGMSVNTALPEILEIAKLPNLELRGIYSHLSCAAHPDDGYSRRQVAAFKLLVAKLRLAGLTFPDVHIAASDGITNFNAALTAPFTLTRCGINLYGFNFNPARHKLRLRPAAQLKAALIAVRTLRAGSGIGYNRMHTLLENTPVGTVAIGYEDGVPLALSNRGYLLIHGQLCPIIGRISMDYLMVSLAHAPGARVGDEAVCFGEQGGNHISLESWTAAKCTHAHDILCGIGSRVARVYLNGQ